MMTSNDRHNNVPVNVMLIRYTIVPTHMSIIYARARQQAKLTNRTKNASYKYTHVRVRVRVRVCVDQIKN